MKKKLFALLLAALMIVSLLPTVSAAESGALSENIHWRFDAATGTLTISGQGEVPELSVDFDRPWDAFLDSIRTVVIEEGITRVGRHWFNGHTALTSVTLPEGLLSIGDMAFFRCAALTEVILPEGLTEICTSAFNESGLTHIEIPDSVTHLGNAVFSGCADLVSVKLPAGLVRAQGGVFDSCISLKEVIMPQMPDLESFGEYFFLNCDSLTDLSFYTAPFIDSNMFNSCDGLVDITIPACVTRFCQQNWAFVFKKCANLATVTIHPGVEIVGNGSFENCPALEAVYFQGDAPAFGTGAFRDTTTTCYYPEGNATWTEEVLQDYGGTVTWIPYEVKYNPFADVKDTDYFFEPVLWAVKNGITAGMSANTFAPNAPCTRAQVVTFLYRAAGSPEPTITENPFTDVKSTDYFYKAVLWAVEMGITSGTGNGRFSPNDPCTRAQVVTFLHRAAGTPAPENTDNPFTDVTASDYFYNAVLWARSTNVTQGTSVTAFSPNNDCTRGQVVTFLYRTHN